MLIVNLKIFVEKSFFKFYFINKLLILHYFYVYLYEYKLLLKTISIFKDKD